MSGPDAQLARKVQQLQDQIINDEKRPGQQHDYDEGTGTSTEMMHVLNVLQQSRLDAGRAAQIGVAANARSWSKKKGSMLKQCYSEQSLCTLMTWKWTL